MTRQEKLSQAVEKEIRMVIGDLTMQLLVTRTALALAQEEEEEQRAEPPSNVTPVRPNREGAA